MSKCFSCTCFKENTIHRTFECKVNCHECRHHKKQFDEKPCGNCGFNNNCLFENNTKTILYPLIFHKKKNAIVPIRQIEYDDDGNITEIEVWDEYGIETLEIGEFELMNEIKTYAQKK